MPSRATQPPPPNAPAVFYLLEMLRNEYYWKIYTPYRTDPKPPNDGACASPRRLPPASSSAGPPSSEERLFETEGWEGEADVFDWEPFRLLGRSMVDYMVNYYQQVEVHPVQARVEPGYLQV